jgi:dihydroorotate dehydrogenase/Pyruvate/2-oxoacid:ferredoxin oxidoreductase delta subunit
MATQFYLDKTLEIMTILKKKLPKEVPIIAQPHVAGADIGAWVDLCRVLEQAGADGLELNVACPISLVGCEETAPSVKLIEEVDTLEMRVLKKMGLTLSMGEMLEVLGPLTKACVEAATIPVGVKPSAEAGFPKCVALARICADAGARWITNITAPISVAPPKIYEKGKTPWDIVRFPINPLSGVSGPNNRYQCYKDTVTVAQFVPEIDICAVGGLVNPEHCVEVIMMGAKAVGLSSGFFWRGRKLIADSVEFLNRFMDEQGYYRVQDMVGLGLAYVRPVDNSIDWEIGRVTAKVDNTKCVKCGVCYNGFCPVPVKGSDGVPVIDKVNCQACGYCMAICPSGALSIAEV